MSSDPTLSETEFVSERTWEMYVGDMLRFAQRVVEYTDGFDQEKFVTSGLTYDATLRNLELIGEAAARIPSEIQATMPQIPWRQIIATRNRVIHGYLGLDNDTLWSIIQTDVPALIAELEKLPSGGAEALRALFEQRLRR